MFLANRVDVAGKLHTTVCEDYQVVANTLDIGDQVGGQHNCRAVGSDGVNQLREEVTPGERIEGRRRLVEEEQVRMLPEGESEADLRPLTAGQLPDRTIQRDATPVHPLACSAVIPPRIAGPAEVQRIGDRESRVQGAILGDIPHSPEDELGLPLWRPSQRLDPTRVRSSGGRSRG